MRLLALFAAACCTLGAAAAEPLVAVAANIAPVLQELGADFEHSGGAPVRFSSGSSGDLLRQIEQGAPFEIYIAAAPHYSARVVAGGYADGDAVTLAAAQLGAFVPRESGLATATDIESLGRLLAAGKYRRIALANPEVAPFGVAAQQALRNMGVWAMETDRIVMGANVAQAVQFTLAGGVDAGFIPASYALLPGVAARGRFHPIPAHWHDPLLQSMVLLRRAGPQARAFHAYLQSGPARALLARSGYTVPDP